MIPNNIFNFTIKDMIDAGVHFGHRTERWNPKMKNYIYGKKDGIHIINLDYTARALVHAMLLLKEIASKNGSVLFVGTKGQAADIIAEYARRCGQHYVNKRWLGGTLTNWHTISQSLKTMRSYEAAIADTDEFNALKKKERLNFLRKYEKLKAVLGGIADMGGMPSALVIIDTNIESTAIKEAATLGIPVIAVVDTNAKLDNVDCVIPGNDDSRKAITLYCRAFSDAILLGIQESMAASGVDLGALAETTAQDQTQSAVEASQAEELKKEEQNDKE